MNMLSTTQGPTSHFCRCKQLAVFSSNIKHNACFGSLSSLQTHCCTWLAALCFVSETDPAEVGEMYYPKPGTTEAVAAESGDWLSKRGTSKLEGYHSHLHAMLSGNNYSPEMADALLLFGNFRWNIKRGIDNRGKDNYGCFDLWQIDKINSNMARLGKPLPYPNWKMPKLPVGYTEKFGCRYVPPELDMLAAQAEEQQAAAAAAKAAAMAAAVPAADVADTPAAATTRNTMEAGGQVPTATYATITGEWQNIASA
jgi:hypothetical protein